MARMRTSSALELLVPLDRDGPEPLHRQLEQGLREAVRSGRLAAGTALPSTRALAVQLAVSRGIVVEAYEQLGAEGYLATTAGRRHPGCDQVAAAAHPTHASDAGHRLRRRLPAGPARSRPLPARDLAALGQAGARHRPEPAARLSRRARDARAARCPGRLPQSRPGYGRGRRIRSSSAPGSRRASSWSARSCATRGARRIAIEDPTQPESRRGPALDRPRGRRDPGRRRRDARGAARWRPRRGRVADRRPPVPDRRRAATRPTGGAHGLGRTRRWHRHRGRLRRRVPLRPRADRGDAGPVSRTGSSMPGPPARSSRPACGLAGSSFRPSWPTASPRPRKRPTSVRPRSTSSPSPTSSPVASSTATCAGCGRSTARAGTSSWRRSPGTCPSFGRSARRPGLHVLAWLPPDLDEIEIIEAAGRSGIRLQGVGRRRPGVRDRRGGAVRVG